MPVALFDLDDTLINRAQALSYWVTAFCRAQGLDAEAEQHLIDRLRARAHPQTFEQLRQELALEVPAAQLWADYVNGIAAGAVPNPGAVTGLERLRAAGWTLGILTNGAADIQRAKIEQTGLADKVDAVAISEEIAARKPGRGAFEVATARCDSVPSHDVWFIGNSPETDIDGARRVGLSTIWVGEASAWPPHLPSYDRSAPGVDGAIGILLTGGDQ